MGLDKMMYQKTHCSFYLKLCISDTNLNTKRKSNVNGDQAHQENLVTLFLCQVSSFWI